MSQLKIRRKKKESKKKDLKSKKEVRYEKEKRDLVDNLDLIANMIMNKNYAWYTGHTNADCISCNHVAKEMIRTGALVFCLECFTSIFDIKAESRDKEAYKKWLDIQSDQWQEELSE